MKKQKDKPEQPGSGALKPIKGFSAYMIGQTQVRYKRERGEKGLDKPYADSGMLLHGLARGGNLILKKAHTSGDPLRAKYYELPEGALLTAGDRVVEDAPEAPVQLVRISDIEFDPKLFVPMVGGNGLDGCLSADGGVMPGTNYVLLGDPGIGKSTVVLDYGVQIEATGKKVLRIEAEMTRIDNAGYCQRFPEFGKIRTLIMADYRDRDPRKVVEGVLSEGWDLVIIDSVAELCEDFREAGLSQRSAERWVIDTMVHHNEGNNKGKHYTTFLVVQQVNKGGNFVGSNKWKHNTTGMIEMRFNRKDRVIIVKKNRRGYKYDALQFTIKGGSIKYNEEMALATLAMQEMDSRTSEETERLTSEFAARFTGTKDTQAQAPSAADEEENDDEE